MYGFYDECKRRTNVKVWKTFVDVFNSLPIAGLVAGKIFCVHGGLSPSLTAMDDIRTIIRPTDVPEFGLLNDLLWADPSDTAVDWEDSERGVSYCFGKKVVNEFLSKFDLDLVCRAHMVVEDGYQFFNERTLVTVFSAPNYCGEFDNFGAIMSVNEELLCSFELLTPMDHPAVKIPYKEGRRQRYVNHTQKHSCINMTIPNQIKQPSYDGSSFFFGRFCCQSINMYIVSFHSLPIFNMCINDHVLDISRALITTNYITVAAMFKQDIFLSPPFFFPTLHIFFSFS